MQMEFRTEDESQDETTEPSANNNNRNKRTQNFEQILSSSHRWINQFYNYHYG